MSTQSPSPGAPQARPLAVGIDLGTTMSVAAYVDAEGRPVSVTNEQGESLIPSALFIDDKITVGTPALDQASSAPDRYADCFKRQIGKPHFPRTLRNFRVPPEVLSAFVLEQLKKNLEQAVGPVQQVVISVPAYFDERRRKATIEAGRLAGLDVVDIINEPTAAAILQGYQQQNSTDPRPAGSQILVYDLGGGTFDVTVLRQEGPRLTTLATDGDVQLGGRDLDEKLADYLADRFVEQHGVDPRTDAQGYQTLLQTAEQVKHALSYDESAAAVVHWAKLRMSLTMTREEIERLIAPFIERTLETCSQVLREAKLGWQEIHEILLVGGSSRIPMITRELLARTGVQPVLADNPDEIVAQGAALFAATRTGGGAEKLEIVNVNSHSLGIRGVDVQTQQPINKILIPRNTPLPASATYKFVLRNDNQPTASVEILEGESENPKFCVSLGRCVIQLEPGLEKGTRVEVICQYDAKGTISVAARIPSTRESAHVHIQREEGNRLDALDVWRNRLTGVEVKPTAVRPAAAKPPAAQPSGPDNAPLVKRLDALHAEVGKLAVNQTLPVSVVPIQRTLRAAQQEQDLLGKVLARAQRAQDRTEDRFERGRISGDVAHLKMLQSQAGVLLNHAFVVLGRECCAASFHPPGATTYLDEINSLQASLDDPT